MAKGITRIADMAPASTEDEQPQDTSTSAQMEYLRAVQERPLDFHTNSVARQRAVKEPT